MADAFRYLRLSEPGEVLWVTINRPGDRNSLNSELMAEITSLLDQVERTSARALVFTGAGETFFIGGADGVEMMQLKPEGLRVFSRRIQALCRRLEQSRLILVAAIDGLCYGGGFEFALACDLRVATSTSRIGLPEVKVGLIPGGGGTQRLPALVGLGRAMEMILAGRLYKGDEAAREGLIHQAVEPGHLKLGVQTLLDPMLKRPQYVLSLAKQAVYASRTPEGLEVESELFSRCLEHDFFSKLMRQQLKSGVLKTTLDVSNLIEEED
ncbi:MAG: enoyl-CoA hydratase/isomerase family protein [Pseudomonadota bacterium]